MHLSRKQIFLLFFMFFCTNLFAQEQRSQYLKSGFERIIRGIQQLGSFSDLLIRSNLMRDEKLPFSSSRKISEQFEIETDTVILSIKNEFGKVNIKSWNNPIIRVEATITAGGNSKDVVDQLVNSFELSTSKEENNFHIQSKTPETNIEYLQIDYELMVPRFSSISVDNFFGDVTIRDILGNVSILCQFGNVDVQNIGGAVSIQMQGEFSLSLKKVTGNAVLNLARTRAEIVDMGGDINLNSSMCDVVLREISSPKVQINMDGGELRYYLSAGKESSITGSMVGGEFVSDLPVVKKSVGYFNKIELLNPESKRELYLSANFSKIVIQSGSEADSGVSEKVSTAKPFTDMIVLEESANPEDILIINNQRGGIHLIGSDQNKVTIKISRLVWLNDSEKAPVVMEKIVRDFHRTDNRLYLTIGGLLDGLGVDVADWRVEIQILCPSFIGVDVISGGGECTFESMEKNLRVNQEGGNLSLRNIKGEYVVSMVNGNVYIEGSEGVGDINIKKGSVNTKFVGGNLTINGVEAKINLEDSTASTKVVNQNGEIKALFLSDIMSDLDLKCMGGGISIILPSNPNCKVKAKAVNGIIDSTYTLTGSFSRVNQEGETVLGDGKFSLLLETNDGNIFIGGKFSMENQEQKGEVSSF